MSSEIILGRYQILEPLGTGAMGTTFVAMDLQRPGNPRCVVKKFTPIYTDSRSLEIAKRLFDEEAKTLEKLGTHPQIPRLLAYGTEEGEFYLVQELIEGQDLAHELSGNNRLTQAEVINFLKDILGVLEFVQENGVIHRDLKPSNLIRRSCDRKIVLIDFGAVKQINNQIVDPQGEVRPPTIIGTPGYMPMEQYRGEPGFYSDIYAVGIIAIQALTGISPTKVANNEESLENWREKVQISPNFAEIIDKMSKDRYRERYQTASEALEALKVLYAHKPNGAQATVLLGQEPQETYIESGENRPKKSRLLSLGLGGIAAIVVASFIGYGVNNFLPQKYLNYKNDNISINYPEQWTVIESPDLLTNTITFSSPQKGDQDFADNVSVRIDDLSSNPMSLQEYTKLNINQIKNLSKADISEQTQTNLSTSPALSVIYTKTSPDNNQTELKVMEVWTVRNYKAYTLSYEAEKKDFDKYLKQFNTMIGSFKLED